MAEAKKDTLPLNAPYKEQYVPYEKRESNNLSWKPFAIDMLRFLVVAKLSGWVGYFVGKNLEKNNIRIGKIKLDRTWGGIILGTIGGVSELFRHWKKTEGKRLGVSSISGDLTTAMDPALLEREAKKEEALVADLKKLTELQVAPKSFTADLAEKREAQAATAERGA